MFNISRSRKNPTRQSRIAGTVGMESLEARQLLSGVRTSQEAFVWRGTQVEAVQNSWVLSFDTTQSAAQARARAAQVATALGVQVSAIETTPRGKFARLQTSGRINEQAADRALSQFGFLRGVQPETLRQIQLTPNDARFGEQWGHRNTGQSVPSEDGAQPTAGLAGADVRSPNAWDITTGSDRVVIAVLDTGVDITHPDLAGNIYRNPGEIPNDGIDNDANGFIDDVSGWDFANNNNQTTFQDNDPSDPVGQGHGTAVAGVIGAVGGNGIGVAGVAWNVSILPVKIFPDTGGAPLFSILSAYDYVITLRTRGVNIVALNASYGEVGQGGGIFDAAEESAVQDVTSTGVLFVAAAGNESLDNDGPVRGYPASYANPDIISVASTNNLDQLSGFSNFGLTSVDLGAPGEGILTTRNRGGYEFISGTSFSAPYTSGVLALMASANRFATTQQLKNALLANVDLIPALQGKTVTGGRLNAFRAVQAIQIPGPIVTTITPGTQAAQVNELTVTFNKPIDAGTFSPSRIELKRANGATSFDGSETDYSLSGATITLSPDSRTVRIALPTTLPRDLYRLILRGDGLRDASGNFLNGDTVSGRDEVYDFTIVAFRGVLEPNDTISTATPLVLNSAGMAEIADLVIGDGLNGRRDVDMFRVFVSGPSLVSGQITSRAVPGVARLDTYIRLFDASGVELARNDNFNGLDGRVQYFVPAAGQYYFGVSSYPNTNYDPNTEASGRAGDTDGTYSIMVSALSSPSDVSTYTGTGGSITDLNTITSTIVVPDGRTITDLSVRVNITHTFVADLSITLTGPNGLVIQLFNRRGAPGANLTNTVFVNSGSGGPISGGTAPFTGRFRPEQPLGSLVGRQASGTWTLSITDNRVLDTGTLNSWAIDLTLSNDAFGPLELNDTQQLATGTNIDGTGTRTFNGFLGDGAFGLKDVDLFSFVAGAGTTLTTTAQVTDGSQLATVLRLFDSQGNEIRADRRKAQSSSIINFVIVTAGTYYVGVSGGKRTGGPGELGNDNYTITSGGTGTSTDATGNYRITITVAGGVSEGPRSLTGSQISLGLSENGAIGSGTGGGLRLGGLDFFDAGLAPQTFYGATVDGFVFRNTSDSTQVDLPVSIASESDFNNRRTIVSGLFRSLNVQRSFSFGKDERFIAVDVTLTNTATIPINDIAWMEGFNPNPLPAGQGGNTSTFNNVRNFTGGGALPHLAVASLGAGGRTIGLGAPANSRFNIVTSFNGPDQSRDPIAVVLNPSDPDPTDSGTVAGDQDMVLAVNLGSLGPSQKASFRYFILVGNTLGEVNSQFDALTSGNGTGHLVADPNSLSIPAASLPYALYYPEGYANSRANTFVPIINAQQESVRVVVIARYENTNFAPDVLFDSATDNPASNGLVPPTIRGGVTITRPDLYAAGDSARVRSEFTGRLGVRKDTPFALEIRSSLPVGATMSHYDFGIVTGQSFISQTSSTWTFAEGEKNPGITDVITVYNPSSISIKVSMTVYPRSGAAPFTVLGLLGAGRRGGWNLAAFNDAQVPLGKFGIRIDADQPIVAALTHFDSNNRQGYGAVGLPSLGATSGGTGSGQVGLAATRENIAIFNPGTQTSQVTINFAFSNGSALRRTVNVSPGRSSSINVLNLTGFPQGLAYGVTYTSTQPVTLSMPSYTSSASSGTTLTDQGATQWLFGEGFRPLRGNTTAEYVRIYNPAAIDTTVEITLSFTDGTSEKFRRTVPSRTTASYNLFDFVTGTRRDPGTSPGVGSFFGTRITAPTPIIAFLSHTDTFLGGGFGLLGTPIGTTGAVN